MVHSRNEHYLTGYFNRSGDRMNNEQYEKECVNSACSCAKSGLTAYGHIELSAIDESIRRLEHDIANLQARRREVINRYSLNKLPLQHEAKP